MLGLAGKDDRQPPPMGEIPLSGQDFGFPYPTPYQIQLDFMQNLYQAIEAGKFGIFESPTGTGKSLSLICGALKWLKDHEERESNDSAETSSKDGSGPDNGEPDWIKKFRAERQKKKATREKEELQKRYDEWVEWVRAKEQQQQQRHGKKVHKSGGGDGGSIKGNTGIGKDEDSEDDLVVEDYRSDDQGESGRTFSGRSRWSGPRYSDQVAKLLDKYDNRDIIFDDEADDSNRFHERPLQPHTTKIIFASRTHSQLSQFISELRRTTYWKEDKVVTIPLGSRMQLCINDAVRRNAKGSVTRMNEKCLDMQQKGGIHRCRYLPSGEVPMLDFCDGIKHELLDIEELATEGRRGQICPYYGARAQIASARVVTLPYNLLLLRSARESLGLVLKDNVVIIDEAHNLVDAITSMHSVTLKASTISVGIRLFEAYYKRYWNRLKGSNVVYIRQIITMLKALDRYLQIETQRLQNQDSSGGARAGTSGEAGKAATLSRVMTTNDLLHAVRVDNINVYKLDQYFRDSQIARKLNMFIERINPLETDTAEKDLQPIPRRQKKAKRTYGQRADNLSDDKELKQGNRNAGVVQLAAGSATTHVSNIESFFNCLGQPNVNEGRIFLNISRPAISGSERGAVDGLGEGADAELRHTLLDPSDSFSSVLREARAVILAGGTMAPINTLLQQLQPSLTAIADHEDPARKPIHIFECGHVIPPHHIKPVVIGRGPTGSPLRFTFDKQQDPAAIREAGQALASLVNVIKGGVVVFFPSYGCLARMRRQWMAEGILARIERRKKVFCEPTSSASNLSASLWDGGDGPKGEAPDPGTTATVTTSIPSSVDQMLRLYAENITKTGGAVLFSVVGGKMSEGINFADDMGRAVVMIGLPYPNLHSPELLEKIRYIQGSSQNPLPAAHGLGGDGSGQLKMNERGNEFYINLCMRAVNQSIGRAIRHASDYAAIVFMDARYATPRISEKLPGWMLESAKPREGIGGSRLCEHDFGSALSEIARFFRSFSSNNDGISTSNECRG
ncbi:ATP-dependent DNA helicase chl1 [Spiromyces aspiralis]|uniref:ATP-dependent DNA helicase chl1 n=1 Tax=Spiromyces aspiralis TaxID=68401 RepID=A0ACC1HHN1_9FUNG|nr:ATP-dependent DNA helicase chl1 [Spiromyces aspiralis]